MPKRRARGDGTCFKQPGRRGYRIQFTVKGVKYSETVKTDDEQTARSILRDRLTEVESGISVDHRKLTFRDLAVDLVNYYTVRNLESAKDQIHRLDFRIMPVIGAKKIVDIHTADFEAIAAKMKLDGVIRTKKDGTKIRREVSNAEINRVIAVAEHAFNEAFKSGKIKLPAPYFKKLPELRKRTTSWKESEIPVLIKHAIDYLKPLIGFMSITGWRSCKEAPRLIWKENVDFERREIRLIEGTTKNKEPRTFPFIPPLEELLTEQWNRTKELERKLGMIIPWVFHRNGQEIKNYSRQWYKTVKAAGFVGKKRHDFRSTAAKLLRKYGFTEGEIIKLVGWSEKSGDQMLRYYEVVTNEDLHERAKSLYDKAKTSSTK